MSAAVFLGPELGGVQRVVAVILGGGRGTRLFPLTRERAKPAVPVAGRYRLVDIPLSNCINSGINRVYVLTQFNSRSLHRHINDSYKFDGFSGGFVEVLAAEQTVERGDWFQGTADAIRQSMWHLRNAECEHYLILSGDHLYRMDYRDFLAHHVSRGADVTVATLPVDRREAKGFGILKVQDDGRITEFVEKPQTESLLDQLVSPKSVLDAFGFDPGDGREFLASMGVYLFRAKVLEELLASRKDWIDFGKHVIPESLKSHNIHSYLFDGYWEDIGTVRSYYNVSMQLVKPDPPFEFLEPGAPIYTRPRYLPGSRIRSAQISDSIICEGSAIARATVNDSIVGIRSRIGEDTVISKSILMGADYFEHGPTREGIPLGIGHGTVIERAIVDKNARIGANVIIRGREDMPHHQGDAHAVVDGIVIIMKGATIPDGTVIE